ncbi:MAG: efflux RND transporter periplasmic adaptor subunit [Piscinibacter sp.]|nr:efflux RND transporter periplasmic adaptor subunit [Piscinibacter sp.]
MGPLERLPGRGRELLEAAAILSALAAAAAVAAFAAATAPGPSVAVPSDAPPALASAAVVARGSPGRTAHEGVVEALRQTVVAAQLPGAVVALPVRAGDRVRSGQVLLRLDARAADQGAAAGAAQARAARAALEEAAHDFERQRQLFTQGFISQAALDRAQAHLRTAEAADAAQRAGAAAARTGSDLHVVRAPYAGVVAQVSVVLGDMALPGRALLTLYDPSALRVTAAIPQGAAAAWDASTPPPVEIPGAAPGLVQPIRAHLLPLVDAASHTRELRLDLPADLRAAPGMFARVWLTEAEPPGGAAGGHLFVPSQALVRRGDFSAVYVLGADGLPRLRLVRPGRRGDGEVEILSGVAAGERVALEAPRVPPAH